MFAITIIKTFYKNQTEVAEAINFVMGSYWADKVTEKDNNKAPKGRKDL